MPFSKTTVLSNAFFKAGLPIQRVGVDHRGQPEITYSRDLNPSEKAAVAGIVADYARFGAVLTDKEYLTLQESDVKDKEIESSRNLIDLIRATIENVNATDDEIIEAAKGRNKQAKNRKK